MIKITNDFGVSYEDVIFDNKVINSCAKDIDLNGNILEAYAFTAFGAENWRDMGIGWDKPVKKLLK